MNWKKQLMLAAVLIIALSMAAGAYHTEAATQVNSQAIVLTQKTSVGGKLFFVIDVQKLRQTYPQAVAVNVFMDTDPGAAITSTSVPLIYSGGTYNGIKAPYNQYLKLDTSGIGENLLLVSIELPSNNAWWVDVNSSTKINYAEANTVYLKIQIDKNTVAVMDGHFSITNNTLVGKYSIDDTDFSYTGFNAEWYGGPATTKSTGGYIELIHGNGTPLNLTNGKDASWVKYWVYAINENEEYVLFNVTMTPSGIINSGSQMFKLVNVTYYNVSTSLVKFGLVNLTDFPVTPTGTSNVSGGLAFPYGEYGQLLYNVKVSPISDEAYPYKFDNNTNTVTINLSSTSYLQLLLEDTNSVYTIGKITPDGVTGTLTYYTYNSTAYQFQKPGSKNFTVDDVFNETSDKAFEVYVIKWSTVPNIKVYPSLTIASTAPGTIGGPILGSQMNPGDEFKVIGHNLPAGANFTAVSLAYWNGNSKAFEAWETIDVWNNSNVSLTYGNISAIVKVPAHWYGGETFYPMLTVNETGTLYTTWITNSSSLQIYPYAKAYVLLNNGHFRPIGGAKLAPGDYILIKGVGFITTENLTPFLTYDYSSMKNALKTMVTLSDIQGLDTNWDGEVDALFVKDDATGNISIVVKLPTDINITKLAHGFKFGLKGSGDNIGFTISAASSVVYDGSTAKVFIWPYGDNLARFFANTTTLYVWSMLDDVHVYPYKAFETINGVSPNDVKFIVEIIGFPMNKNAVVDVNLNKTDGTIFNKLTTLNATKDLVQGYAELEFNTPTLPGGNYEVVVNETGLTSSTKSQYNVVVLPIIGYKTSGESSYELVKGTITLTPGSKVEIIGFGFPANVKIYGKSYTPSIGSPIMIAKTDKNGTFTAVMDTAYLLKLSGRSSGIFQIRLNIGSLWGPTLVRFNVVINERPVFEISVKANSDALVGDTIYVSIKLLLKYRSDIVPMLSMPPDKAKLNYIKLWFIYGPNDVKQVTISDLSVSPVVYYNQETSEVVVAFKIDHQPANGTLVVDALANASLFGGYFNTVATDHAIVSVNAKIADMLNNAATAASDAKAAAEKAASAAQQAATEASNAKTAASSAATAAQKAATAAQSAANAASAAQKSADTAAQKISSVSDSLTKQMKDVSSKIDAANSAAGSAKTYSLVNTILIIITLLVAIYLVAKMKP